MSDAHEDDEGVLAPEDEPELAASQVSNAFAMLGDTDSESEDEVDSAAAECYECEQGCGFQGDFAAVAAHEGVCNHDLSKCSSQRSTPEQAASDTAAPEPEPAAPEPSSPPGAAVASVDVEAVAAKKREKNARKKARAKAAKAAKKLENNTEMLDAAVPLASAAGGDSGGDSAPKDAAAEAAKAAARAAEREMLKAKLHAARNKKAAGANAEQHGMFEDPFADLKAGGASGSGAADHHSGSKSEKVSGYRKQANYGATKFIKP